MPSVPPPLFRALSEDDAADPPVPVTVTVDGTAVAAQLGRPLVEALQVAADGEVVRACATPVTAGLQVTTVGRSAAAREEAGQRLIRKHVLYCTICDNDNGDCATKHGVEASGVVTERIGHQPTPCDIDDSNPFYRYHLDQCILCGRCVEACQDVQVTRPCRSGDRWHPRVLWDGGEKSEGSSEIHLDLRQGQVRLGPHQRPGLADLAPDPGRRPLPRGQPSEALELVARRLRETVSEHGPDAAVAHRGLRRRRRVDE